MAKKVAKCYGVWGDPYYRTEDGHTFSIKYTSQGTRVFYHGNVVLGAGKMHMLTDEETKRLFEQVQFED